MVDLKKVNYQNKNYNTGKYCNHFSLIYSRDANVNQDIEILPHGNSKNNSSRRTYTHQIKFLKWRINYFHQDIL